MKHTQYRFCAAALCGMLLFALPACGNADTATKTNTREPNAAGEEVIAEEALPTGAHSLEMFRQKLAEKEKLFAVAYLDEADANRPFAEDPAAFLWNAVPATMEAMGFLGEIPKENIIGEPIGDIYCLVPVKEGISVTVNTADAGEKQLYQSDSGSPIFLCAGNSGIMETPLLYAAVTDTEGHTFLWYPMHDEMGYADIPYEDAASAPMLDFSHYGDVTAPYFAMGMMPPTIANLADTSWVAGDWFLDLRYDPAQSPYCGTVELYRISAENAEYTDMYTGYWAMQEGALQLAFDGAGAEACSGVYPVLVDLDGENLYLSLPMDAAAAPPFFGEGVMELTMIRTYG